MVQGKEARENGVEGSSHKDGWTATKMISAMTMVTMLMILDKDSEYPYINKVKETSVEKGKRGISILWKEEDE